MIRTETDEKWLDVTGYDVDELEVFKLSLKVEKIIAIAEDAFTMFDEINVRDIEHKGCEITIEGILCYKVLETYQEVLEKLNGDVKNNENIKKDCTCTICTIFSSLS